MYCTVCGGVVDADVDEKQVMKLVKNQKGAVQDCAVVLFGVCEECLKKQAAQKRAIRRKKFAFPLALCRQTGYTKKSFSENKKRNRGTVFQSGRG